MFNPIPLTLAEIGFSNPNASPPDYHMTASTPSAITQGGLNAAQNVCGSTGNLSCGNITTDKDGKLRPTSDPYSIGAYQYP